MDRYKPYEAVDRAAALCKAVNEETEARRTALLKEIRATTEQVARAQTLAEVEKLQVVAAAQNATLASIDAERMAALSTIMIQEIENRSDEKRQAEARNEESSIDFQFASKKATTFLTPFSSTLAVPSRKAGR